MQGPSGQVEVEEATARSPTLSEPWARCQYPGPTRFPIRGCINPDSAWYSDHCPSRDQPPLPLPPRPCAIISAPRFRAPPRGLAQAPPLPI